MEAEKNTEKKHGLTIVYTGNGKGKTTAALGMLLRASGHDMKIGVIQFIKGPGNDYGEAVSAHRLGFDYFTLGDGFTWKVKDLNNSKELARYAWEKAKTWISENRYEVVLLDEFVYPLNFKWLDAREVVDWLKNNKPPELHLIITGRNAPAELVEFADLVSEVKEIKHPYREQGITAQAGIEY